MNEARKPPRVEGAIGLVWKPTKKGWLCIWQARTDLIERGWLPKSVRLWSGDNPSPTIEGFIRDWSNRIQDEMLAWSRGGVPEALPYDGTWGGLIRSYQTDKDSNFRTLRYRTRSSYAYAMGRIERTISDIETGQTFDKDLVGETKARHFLRLHEKWSEGGNVTSARAAVTMLRILSNFGATILDDEGCRSAAYILSKMRFKTSQPRNVFLTAEHVEGIRTAAHTLDMPYVALAQAIQFECILRQKDVIGEWVPVSEPGISYVLNGNDKWLRGITWEEIDQNLTLRHITSKRDKEVVVPLGSAPMIMEEFAKMFGSPVTRDKLPAKGPVIVDHRIDTPYPTWRFRSHWKKCATLAGVPKGITNMDSRAGAITEASESGAPMEHIKQAATHSQMQQTEKYARNPEAKTANVLTMRAASRKNK